MNCRNMIGVRAQRQQAIANRRHRLSICIPKCNSEQRLSSRLSLRLKFQGARIRGCAKFAYDFARPFADPPEVNRSIGSRGHRVLGRDLALPKHLQFRSSLYLQFAIIAQCQHAGQRNAPRPSCLRSLATRPGFLYPAPQYSTPISVGHAPGSVVGAVIENAPGFRVKPQLQLVEHSHFPKSGMLSGVDQNMSISEWEEVGTLPHLATWNRVRERLSVPGALRKWMDVLPMKHILRPVKKNGSSNLRESGTHAHVPGIPRFPAKRVSEACHQHPGWRPSNYWRGQFFKLPKIGVRRRGYALGFPQSLCSDRFLLTRNLRHAGIDNARTFAARHDPTGKGSI